MPTLTWDTVGQRFYEVGVDHGVLYLVGTNGEYTNGVAWNGLTAVTESPSGADANPQYADNIKYLNIIAAEEFGATVEAFSYPKEFAECDGTAEVAPGVMVGQQARKGFGFSFRTKVGNDTVGQDAGYKIHLIYSAQAAPSERAYNTISDSVEPMTFSWELTTTSVPVDGMRPTSNITINSLLVDKTKLAALEAVLYGTDTNPARLPLPAEVFSLLGVPGAPA